MFLLHDAERERPVASWAASLIADEPVPSKRPRLLLAHELGHLAEPIQSAAVDEQRAYAGLAAELLLADL